MAIREQLILEGVNKTGKAFGKAQQDLKNLDNVMGDIIKTAGAVVAALGFGRAVSSTVKTIRTFEDLNATLTTVQGSAEGAAQAFEMIRKFTAGTTFQLDEVSQSFITLRNAGLTPTSEMMTDIGNIAAGMGKRLDDVARAVFNATTGEFEMLKQLGIKVKKEGDNITAIFRGVETQMAFNTENIINYLRQIGAEDFAGALEARANTLTGAISNLEDQVSEFQMAIGEAGLRVELVGLARDLQEIVAESDNLAEALGVGAANAVSTFREAIQLANNNIDELKGALGVIATLGAASVIKRIALAIRGMSLAIAANPIGALVTSVIALIGYLGFKNGLGRTVAQVQAAFEYFGTVLSKFRDYIAGKLSTAIDFIKNQFIRFANKILIAYNAIAEFIPVLDKVDEIGEQISITIADGVGEAFDYVADKGGEFADFLAKRLEELAGSGQDLADVIRKAGEEYDEFQKMVQRANQMDEQLRTGGMLPDPDKPEKGGTGTQTDAGLSKEAQKHADALAERFLRIRDSLRSEEQVLMDQKQDELDTIREYYGDRIAFDENYLKMKQALDEKFARAEERLRQKRVNDQFDIIRDGKMSELDLTKLTEGEIGDLTKKAGRQALEELARVNRRAFELNKAMNIAEAIMNTATGVTKALAQGGVFGPLLAGAIFAMGAAQIATISQQQYTGRRFGGPVVGGHSYIVGENQPEIFTPRTNGEITPLNKLDGDREPVQVVFQIQANDTRGFDDLIKQRRGLIVNMINDAVMNKGKEALI